MSFELGPSLLDSLPDAVIALSEAGAVMWWNKTAQSVFGYAREAALGRSVFDLIVPDEGVDHERARLAEAVAGTESAYEAVRRRSDGGLVHVGASLRAVRDEHGEFAYALSTQRDVTALKVARSARLLQSRFGDMLESTPDAIVIADASARIVLVNAHTERLFGRTRAELVGQSVEVLAPERYRAGGQLSARSATLARRSDPSELAGAELYGLHEYGNEFPIEITSCSLRTEEGPMVMHAVRDITDRRRAEQKFRDLLESAPDAMVIVDSTGTIVLVNSQTEALFGYRRDELLGQRIELLVPAQASARHAAYRDGYFRHPRVRAMGVGLDLHGRRKDGSEFPVEVSLSPLATEEGQLVSSAIRDVTERKKFEQHLRDANRMKSEFLANMSHELRTPLNGIIGFSEFLYDERPGTLNARQKEYLGDILSSGRHLLQLINDVLDLSKVEAGRMELFPEVFALDELIDDACAAISPLAQKKRIRIDRRRLGGMLIVELDRQKMKQVLLNLLSNAVKFTPEEGSTTVSYGVEGNDNMVIRVEDSGIGISAQDMGKLFVEFQQVDSGAARRYGGTGLGLALVKRLVELQGGTVGVHSEPGKGSTFTVCMPLAVAQGSLTAGKDSAS